MSSGETEPNLIASACMGEGGGKLTSKGKQILACRTSQIRRLRSKKLLTWRGFKGRTSLIDYPKNVTTSASECIVTYEEKVGEGKSTHTEMDMIATCCGDFS